MHYKLVTAFGLMLTLVGCSNNQVESTEHVVVENKPIVVEQVKPVTLPAIIEQDQVKQYGNDSLLPPMAKPGECYARVWVEPTYKTITDNYVAKEAYEKVTVQPARYEMVNERVVVSEAGTKKVAIPAKYETRTERVLVSEGERSWRTDRNWSSPKANQAVLDAARRGGIDLDNAPVNSCYHEHFTPDRVERYDEQVLVSEATSRVSVSEPVYRWVEEQVLVQEASSRIVTVPAVYRTETERVMDKPAHTVWKKGTGPIQKIDEATGEIMCLVEVPATYKTISRRVISTPATTREEIIPAKYKTVKVRKLVSEGQTTRVDIPAKYKAVTRTRHVDNDERIWHNVNSQQLTKTTRTGNKICLLEKKDRYQNVTKKVVVNEATYRTVDIPAKYKTVQVKKLVVPAKEARTTIPAVEKTVTRRELVRDGRMEWRSILCETNMTRDRIRDIQLALKARGFDPIEIDGVIGKHTMRAVNAFQRKNNLPVDRYLNIETVRALGVSPR
ncbi:peptidoglycan-binding protein [Vibrio sp. SS-MA-C1-2]|uniref:peptidoglycan-binding domain-containing protein n=1 Tax=Vibrio sp. SS-MA-C1-2 TaxID=2908646 RepID=UPI001F1D5F85|nr:peptidoglycan-binding domain-containing protein [Vibrio sp. SS-MA-C1-2]UJF16907.1 peptidoglycan-binding protein [Vibrio sp. SS-MA-C1-2]